MESGKKSLKQLTTAGVFHIPDYQRYYSWREPEWDDLWTDLYTLPEGKQHYFGTIIIQKTERKVRSEQVEGFGGDTTKQINLLIDGQQRLTSLTLLVKSITEHLEDIAPETEHTDEILDAVEKIEEQFLVEDNIYFLELLDDEDWKYLKRIIDDDPQLTPDRPSQDLMIEAKQHFDDQIADLRDDPDRTPIEVANELQQLWKSILDLELMVYVVEADSPEKATLIFDSVNDRGRDLSTFDKTKSFLMRMVYLASDDEDEGQALIDRIRDAFGEMYSQNQRMLDSPYTDDISDDAVQRYHFITFFDWTDRQDHQTPTFLDNLKEHVRERREDDPEACLDYIRAYVDSLESGFSDLGDVLDYDDDDEIAGLIDRIHRLRHATKFYPLLLAAWSDLDHEERRELLDAIETFIFRVYAIGNHPTYTGRSSLQTLARDTPPGSPLDVWKRGIVDIMHEYEDDDQFRRTLSSSDLGSNVTSQDLRYLFYFYNESRADEEKESGAISLDEAMGENYTVEHIWPRSPDELPIEDAGEYPSPEQRYDAYKHRLGNLTLASASWNSEWGNKDFETKRDEGYERSKLWVQWDVQEYDEWSVENIEGREETLIDFVMDKWATPDTRLVNVESPESAIEELNERERYVLAALCENPNGAARRVIHRDASDLPDSPFENPDVNGNERWTVGSILSRLATVRLAHRTKSTWYPSDEAQAADIGI